MRLSKLEIKGFKSFKDKTVLQFPDEFTAIVGPNGSGKSNIVDAICFVLGKSRGLRASKLTELIYNGGIGGKPAKYAQVSLYLDGTDTKEKKISRIVDEKGNSVYSLNDKRTTRQEIIEIVGDNEYNIILQADVTQVIDMTPKQRRGIIDELCGIAEYDKKKDKALKELEKVENRISETHLILGEKKGYLSDLKKEREDALEYRELEAKLNGIDAIIIHRKFKDYKDNINELSEKIEKKKEQEKESIEKIAEIKSVILENQKKIKEINRKIHELEGEKGKGILELRTDIAKINEKLEFLKEKLEKGKHEIFTKTDKKVKLQAELQQTKNAVVKLDKKLAVLQEKIDELLKKVDPELEGKIDEVKTKIFENQSQGNSLAEEIEKNKKELTELGDKKESLDAQMQDMLWDERKIARQIDDLNLAHKNSFDEIERLKKENLRLIKNSETLQKKIEDLQIRFANKNAELKAMEKEGGGVRGAINAVLNLKETVSGIHGYAAQLGTPDKRYEKALEVAGGGRLLNIVVENENTASKCITFLKQRRIGRATFLPLNKIKTRLSDYCPPEALGFARDFIETKGKFKKIYDYIYGNTVIVEDIETAKTIGIGKCRMVTLDGDIIESTGAMTGGFVKGGAIKFSSTEALEKELKTIAVKLQKYNDEKEDLASQKRRVENMVAKLEDSTGEGRTEIEKLKLKKNSLTEKRNDLRISIEEIDKKISEINSNIADKEDEIKKLKRDLKVLDEKLQKLIRKKADSAMDKLEKIRDEKRDLDVSKGKHDEKQQAISLQVSELENELKDLLNDKSQTEKDISENTEKYRKLKKELIVKEKENASVINEIEKLISDAGKLELENEEISAEVGKNEAKLRRIEREISKFKQEKALIDGKLSDIQSPEELEKELDEELINKKLDELEGMKASIESKLETYGDVNMKAIEKYEILKKEYTNMTEKLEILKDERQSIFDLMEKIEKRKREVFMATYDVVKENFEEIFAKLSEGTGTLILDNPKDISASGLMIEASPKGKKLLNIDALSGGEKTLTSSAFLLAIQRYKPSSFYIVDEIDAALDKDNSMKLAEMLSNAAAQFVLITHNDQVMKFADIVVGVSMQAGVSQVVGVKLK